MSTGTDELRSRLPGLTLDDEHRLRRRLDQLRGVRDPAARARKHEQLAADVGRAEARIAARAAAVPTVAYPEQLPVSGRREDIAAAIRDHQVVVVAGETGSGKTTQLPKILLELGRGVRGRIGHTQPRRIAARTVAERIAEELGSALGEVVGYKVRFTDQVSDTSLVKLMTDGVLLAEVQRDRLLRQYDTIVVDEAHERSLNIDFLLGYLAQLLPRRPDLKVVITSATIDVDRIAKHFGDAPVVEVSGRTYPVEVRYRPVVDPDDPEADPDRDQVTAIVDACRELVAEGPGDVLVFLAGERDIRDTADALGDAALQAEVLPLYSRLSAADQHKVFQAHTGRRIVLATNVAETSLTVPGIRYVVDPGTARISRYSARTKVQRLPIEDISQASARQRSGRCGRTSDGIAIRLYSEADFESRPEFTDPEILRTSLASVLLQMASLGLGAVEDFPFLDPPDRRAVADGYALLDELGALDDGRLTETGRALAALPLDPRLARMVVEADRRGVLEEVLVIAAGLTVQDVRERPADAQAAADQMHARFAAEDSDFVSLLNLWRYLTEKQSELSGNQFRRTVKREFLHWLRIREWQDLHGQLRGTARRLGMTVQDGRGGVAAEPDERGVHAALLSGLLSQVGLQQDLGKDASPGDKRRGSREYLGARGAKFVIAPGSVLTRKPPRWVVAGELVETSRLFARTVARVDPETIEKLADHLVKRQYSEPRWDAKRGSVVATERITLYGIPLVVGRRVQYGSIDPVVSRELFIRHALVQGEWQTNHRFWAHNQAVLAQVAELEERARRRDLRVDDETVFELYDARVGPEVVSTRHFDTWWKQARRQHPHLLDLTPGMVTDAGVAEQVAAGDFPDEVHLTHGLVLPLSYAFDPGAADDGVTVDVPLGVLDTVAAETSGASLAWTVPGQREELVTALLRGLPKQLRRGLVPIPDRVREVLPHIDPTEPLLPALEREIRRSVAVLVPHDAWAPASVPDHLRATFRVLDDRDRPLASGKDLEALRRQVAGESRKSLAKASADVSRTGLTSWTLGTLPGTVQVDRQGHLVTAYPALVDEGATVGVRVVPTAAEASRLTWLGARRLLLLAVGSPAAKVVKSLQPRTRLALQFNPDGEIPDLVADCVDAAADELIAQHGGPPRTEEAFAVLVEASRTQLHTLTAETVRRVEAVLTQARETAIAIGAAPGRGVPAAVVADLRAQMTGLLHRGFVATLGHRRLRDAVRYLTAMAVRLEKLPAGAGRDAIHQEQVEAVTEEYRQLRSRVPSVGGPDDPVARIRWMVEELRVSLFAPSVGTPRSVSEQRIVKAIDALG
ncbi:ATP-dependent RNA helicase HrpA [Klenkia marina]|uniref:ATP-dependent RNA helicase HrpA n=1 Tax=Klenkia marina TaxID=1960309 RepID=UPI000B85E4BD|nr:ATP-dependent RNA helicase HrpA [Klenkia marina]